MCYLSAYLRSDLMCKSLPNYSNGVCEVVLVKFKKLDTIFGVLYRSPDTALENGRNVLRWWRKKLTLHRPMEITGH